MPTPTDLDCLLNDSCVCPYCGSEDDASWELIGESGETDCGSCGRPYSYERIVSVEYTTSPIMGPHQLTGCYLNHDQDPEP